MTESNKTKIKIIDAMRYDGGESAPGMYKVGFISKGKFHYTREKVRDDLELWILTPEGNKKVNPGDYIGYDKDDNYYILDRRQAKPFILRDKKAGI